MDPIKQFYDAVCRNMTITLATSSGGSVTMRMVSPVVLGRDILIFTCAKSRKYQQLAANPNCCLGIESFFAEATAEFQGPTMSEKNTELRAKYIEKFPGAFDEGVEFGGIKADFVILKPFKLSGWAFDTDSPGAQDFPTIPFELDIG